MGLHYRIPGPPGRAARTGRRRPLAAAAAAAIAGRTVATSEQRPKRPRALDARARAYARLPMPHRHNTPPAVRSDDDERAGRIAGGRAGRDRRHQELAGTGILVAGPIAGTAPLVSVRVP